MRAGNRQWSSALVLSAAGLCFASAADVSPRMLLLDGAVVGPDIVVVGERGTILRSSDSARTWQRGASPTRAALTGVSFAPSETPRPGWAVGHDAQILVSTDAGRTWARQFQGDNLQDSFLDVLALDAQRVIAVGAYGLFVVTSDGGKTWERRKITGDDYHFNRLTRGPSGTLYLAGEHGTLLRSPDQGESWTSLATPYDGSFYGIVPLDGSALLAHGLRGHVFLTANDGDAWQPSPAPQPALLASVLRLKNNVLVFAGQARAMFVSRDFGKSLTALPDPLATGVAKLLELPDGRVLALGEAGATLLPAIR